MNFYKHHLGDYAAATSHLTWDEDCAYRRLIDQYYKREAPLPTGVKETLRIARATSPAQRRAVQVVLDEFFELREDGWHQKRCDEEIKAASAQQETNRRIAEEREAKKRLRIEYESLNGSANESSTNRSPVFMGGRAESVNLARHQTPDSTSQTPDTRLHQGDLQSPRTPLASDGVAIAQPADKPGRARKPQKPKTEPSSGAEAWGSYCSAYEARYDATPVRNAKVNGQLAQLVQRLGVDEAPGVARFYVGHQRQDYVRAMHPVDLLLRDAEGLRTAWATGRQVTNSQATQVDRTQTNANAFAPLLAAARAKEANHG